MRPNGRGRAGATSSSRVRDARGVWWHPDPTVAAFRCLAGALAGAPQSAKSGTSPGRNGRARLHRPGDHPPTMARAPAPVPCSARHACGRRAARLRAAVLTALALATGPAAAGDRTLTEFWPEIDVFVQLNDRMRLLLLGAVTRAAETGTSTESTLGVHLDYFPEGLPTRLLEIAPGMEGRWSIWTRIGYQQIGAWTDARPSESRVLLEATLRSEPLWGAIRLSNRVRLDLRAIGSDTSWRFRNRSRIERTWTLNSASGPTAAVLSMLPAGTLSAVTPYAMIEFFWDDRVSAWSRRFEQFGAEFDMAKNRSLDLYVARQDDLRATGSKLWIGGVALTLRY
jgi:hypothetical protein